jgi:hypothetical protein
MEGTTLNSLNFLMVYLVVVLPTLYDSLYGYLIFCLMA